MKTDVNELALIERLLEKAWSGNAWHGPSISEILPTISATEASYRLPGTHSIIELVGHMTSWRVFVVRKLSGDDKYTVPDESNFPALSDWSSAVKALDESQRALVAAIRNFDEGKLRSLVPHASHRYTFYTLLHGIVHHDLYHLGQIVLLKKSMQA